MEYRSYNLKSFVKHPLVADHLSAQEIEEIRVVAQVFPFKVNNYVIEELIDWENYRNDPIFRLTFPHREMLSEEDFQRVQRALNDPEELKRVVEEIRLKLNPHPAGQLQNIPEINGERLEGSQHKYRETILFFPKQGQTCHAYCTFCFRWPQFVGMEELKFASKEVQLLIDYVKAHPEITDLLFTGGDPLIMSTRLLRAYIEPLLDAAIPHLKNIRIGTKTLGFWPYRFLTDRDADDLLQLFREIREAGYHLAFMAHFNHYRELRTEAVREAVKRIRETGAIIRTQSPVLHHINDDPDIWATMWREQVALDMIPYYMFLARDTGAQHYFGVPLARAWEIYRGAISQVSGLARTARGPSMSATPGKVAIVGVSEIGGEKVFVLNMLQAKRPELVDRPFFAKYDPEALWLDDLQPAFSDKFIFE
ncbi:MAG: lysine 2,3-aminomutase [Epsilonproteobacteria bacterium]|nr:lysine 2,3-aminomutase [Campylobacterota bacterium]NPA56805.1 lysine 2,3-aminomutase [Campylobacterota bacterium]